MTFFDILGLTAIALAAWTLIRLRRQETGM